MFVRFSKRQGDSDKIYRRGVSLNNTYLIQDGNDIVAYAYLKKVDGNINIYSLQIVGDKNKKQTKDIERYTKRFIRNSQKWESDTIKQRRKYNVKYVQEIKHDKIKITKSR